MFFFRSIIYSSVWRQIIIVSSCYEATSDTLASTGLIIASKGLDSKIKKHQEIVTLAIGKRDTVDRMVSKALADKQMSDAEFQLIIRTKLTRQTSRPDIEKIKKDLRGEVEKEFRKKISALGVN